MNIVVASDENYVPHLVTLLVSIGENNREVEKIIVYILDGGIKSESKNIITKLERRYSNLVIHFIEMYEQQLLNMLGGCVDQDRSLSAYARIFVPEIVDEDRALYFDVDAIVLEDLRELYNQDMKNCAIAGVMDTNPIKRHYNVGLKDEDTYINSGMILWNLNICRQIDFVQKCKDFIKRRNGKIDAMDQGTINGVLGREQLIKVLHPKYNVFTSLFQLNSSQIKKIYGLLEYYSDKDIQEAIEHPVFVHYTPNMTTRPWIEHCKHPLATKYWDYRNQTEFANQSLVTDNRSLKRRILGWFYRVNPSLYYIVVSLKSN